MLHTEPEGLAITWQDAGCCVVAVSVIGLTLLFFCGDFYDSFTVTPTANANYTIDSDPMKNGKSLFKRWGENVEGLTDENAEKVIDYLRLEFYKIAFRGLR